MKLAAISLLAPIILPFPANSALAEELRQPLQISVENSSPGKHYFEVRDSVCDLSLANECKNAEIFLKSKKCTNRRWEEKCATSKDLADSQECIAGIIFS